MAVAADPGSQLGQRPFPALFVLVEVEPGLLQDAGAQRPGRRASLLREGQFALAHGCELPTTGENGQSAALEEL